MSEPLSVTRGLRQGCPLSCLCFDLIVELIAIRVRNNQSIEGITIGTKEKFLGQYADDLWVTLKHKKECYIQLFKELDEFANFSGLRYNYDKTEILRIGSLHNTDAAFYSELPLQWSDGPVKVLGIWVTAQIGEMAKINYDSLLTKITNICKIWATRSLTLLGRIQIINTLVIPNLIYRLQVLPSPDKEFYKRYEQLVRNFFVGKWQGQDSISEVN